MDLEKDDYNMAKIGDVGTLRELDVKPGDVVEGVYYGTEKKYTGTVKKRDGRDVWYESGEFDRLDGSDTFRLISRAQPKIWRYMTPEEKGALLLAAHEGKVIEVWGGNGWWSPCSVGRYSCSAYRINHEPKRETVTLYGSWSLTGFWGCSKFEADTHLITFDTIDGVPDCNSVKMEEI